MVAGMANHGHDIPMPRTLARRTQKPFSVVGDALDKTRQNFLIPARTAAAALM
jgi:hypothetical protein